MLRILLCLVLFLGVLRPAGAQPPPSALTADQARAAISVLQDPGQRAALIAALQALGQQAGGPAAKAEAAAPAPAAAAGQPAPAPAAPATAPPAAPAAKPTSDTPTLAPDSLAAQLLTQGSSVADQVSSETISLVRTVTDFPLLWFWASRAAADPEKRGMILHALWHTGIAMVAALALERGVAFLLRRPRAAVARAAPRSAPGTPEEPEPQEEDGIARAEAGESEIRVHHQSRMRAALMLLRRLPYALLALLLNAAPLLAFAVLMHLLTRTPLGVPRSAALTMVGVGGTYVFARIVLVMAGTLLSPHAASLRLLLVSDTLAGFLMRWVRRVVVVAGTGYALATLGLIFDLYPAAHDALLRLTGLLVHLCLVAAVIEVRRPVAAWIAGRGESSLTGVRQRVAAWWHVLAVVLIMGIWFVYAIELRNGMETLLRLLGLSLLVLAGARLANIMAQGAMARALKVGPDAGVQWPALANRAMYYAPVIRHALNMAIGCVTAVVLLQVWGLRSFSWFSPGALGGQAVTTLLRIVVAVVIAVVVWEAANAWLQAHLARLAEEGQVVRAARVRTLLPMIRTVMLVGILLVVGLTALSQIGLDIGPLLAGAGIIGVAIGFGSQKLVQDLINGIFLLLENAMQVGDFVTAGGLSGSVEYLSIRTIRLRAGDGSVHIIPFSAVTTVTNVNRGIGNVPISVEVEFDEDIERVFDGLKEVAKEMRTEPAYTRGIIGDLQLWGVDSVAARTVTVVGQIPCTDGARWGVQREFNRRWKLYVAEHDIALARHPQEWVLRHPLDVRVDEPTPVRGVRKETPSPV